MDILIKPDGIIHIVCHHTWTTIGILDAVIDEVIDADIDAVIDKVIDAVIIVHQT